MSQFLSRAAIAAFCALAISSSATAQTPVPSDSSADMAALTASRSLATIMALPAEPTLTLRNTREEVHRATRC